MVGVSKGAEVLLLVRALRLHGLWPCTCEVLLAAVPAGNALVVAVSQLPLTCLATFCLHVIILGRPHGGMGLVGAAALDALRLLVHDSW